MHLLLPGDLLRDAQRLAASLDLSLDALLEAAWEVTKNELHLELRAPDTGQLLEAPRVHLPAGLHRHLRLADHPEPEPDSPPEPCTLHLPPRVTHELQDLCDHARTSPDRVLSLAFRMARPAFEARRDELQPPQPPPDPAPPAPRPWWRRWR